MKSVLLFLIAFTCINNAIAQKSTPSELFDVLVNLIPDKNADQSMGINKDKAKSKSLGGIQSKIDLSVKGKSLTCESIIGNKAACIWKLNYTPSNGNHIHLSTENLQFLDNSIDMIDFFFDKSKLKAKLMRKDTEGAVQWFYEYLVSIPGKQDFWMRIVYINQTATASQAASSNYTDLFYIEGFVDKKAFDASAL
ncbi:MAG TPA: hypothetical protein PLQ78_09345 [Flavipsychrobacter sp.]|nr:hypothetical protein [Flavipsychrobacter sp.]